jgi:hypothetical protein
VASDIGPNGQMVGGHGFTDWPDALIRDQQRGRIRKETKMTTWKIMALAATTAVLISMLAEGNHFSRFFKEHNLSGISPVVEIHMVGDKK